MTEKRYLVTARKYRPQIFGDLVAQEHVAETLKNAIRLDRLAHAYLFSGPRGVGKTTAARILAKAINCTAAPEERMDGIEPCRECDSCRAFEEGRSLSIFEIDAASNNKVEDVREIRETVRIPPQGGRKKVYIVDEVHMLSNAAFNALLKTLEEPPPHVLFIFATTEPHKVIPTILSRCQRFDFRRIPIPDVVQRLEEICRSEDITADEASLMLIARKGDGALRDSLSVFDQAVALCGTNLVYQELAQALGVVDADLFFEVTDNILGHDSASMLRLVDRIVRAGHDLQEFLAGLAEHLRNLMVGCTTGEAALIEATESMRQRYLDVSERFTENDLLRLLDITSSTESAIRSSSQPRLKVELALLKMASLTRTTDLRTILDRLDSLPQNATDAPPEPRPAPAEKNRRDDDGGTPARRPEPPRVDPPKPDPAPPTSAAQRATREEPEQSDVEVRTRVFKQPALRVRRDDAPPSDAADPNGDGAAVAVAAPAVSGAELDAAWAALIERIEHRPRLVAMVRQAAPRGVSDETLRVAVPNELCLRTLKGEQKALLPELQPLLDVPLHELAFELDPSLVAPHLQETAAAVDPYEYLREKSAEHPVLKVLFEEFGGEITS